MNKLDKYDLPYLEREHDDLAASIYTLEHLSFTKATILSYELDKLLKRLTERKRKTLNLILKIKKEME